MACLVAALGVGCDTDRSSPGSNDAAEPSLPDADVPIQDAGPIADSEAADSAITTCPEFTPLANQDELAQTPRANLELERLALAIGDTFTADASIYERLVVDVSLIRTMFPEVADIEHLPHFDREIFISASHEVTDLMEDGAYTAWDCLNEYYHVTEIGYMRLGFSFDLIRIWFEGIYDLAALAEQYDVLPDINFASPSHYSEGPTICVTIEGDVYHYVFDRAEFCGDGCPYHTYYHFYTAAVDATPVAVGEWYNMSGDPPPGWVAQYTQCP